MDKELEERLNEIKQEFKDNNKCYSCKYRGDVAGSAHSSCNHPAFDELGVHYKFKMLMGGANPTSIVATMTNKETKEVTEVPIQEFDEHGIKNGWVIYPSNFDPVWLEHCLIYSKISNEEDVTG